MVSSPQLTSALGARVARARAPLRRPRLRVFGASAGKGFTLIELVVTLALVGLMAMVAVPLYEVTAIRMKEMELRTALRQIRSALDAYKDAADAGKIQKDPSDSGYPPNLKILVEGVDTAQQSSVNLQSVSSMASGASANANANANASDTGPTRLMFLRQIPRDPFTPDPSLPLEEQWDTRAYGSPPSDPQPGKDVYDVMSKSATIGSNGMAYKEW
ncbi:MAG: type II secretion system protein [Burkholderiaceae bacterium]|nr:type II secretion system protein [Burkholderiaceae bacterium]